MNTTKKICIIIGAIAIISIIVFVIAGLTIGGYAEIEPSSLTNHV